MKTIGVAATELHEAWLDLCIRQGPEALAQQSRMSSAVSEILQIAAVQSYAGNEQAIVEAVIEWRQSPPGHGTVGSLYQQLSKLADSVIAERKPPSPAAEVRAAFEALRATWSLRPPESVRLEAAIARLEAEPEKTP